MWKALRREINAHPKTYLVLGLLLLSGAFVRVYRTDVLLGFYYDQGRDALVIWDFLHKGELFLIGPTTGIEGIFRGAWYYWLITPFYFLGQGDPVWPAVFLALTTVLSIGLTFYLGVKIHSYTAGLIAAFLTGFSFYLMLAARWLSNPTPMLFFSMLLVWSLLMIQEGRRWAWVATGFLLGMAMQFGSAAEVFYFPAVATFALLNRKNWPSVKLSALSLAAVFLAFVPQLVFDLIHNGVLRAAIGKFLAQDSFKLSFWEVVKIRLPFYYDVFYSKLDAVNANVRNLFLVSSLVLFGFYLKKLLQNRKVVPLVLLFFSPLFGMLFFQGNFGNVYDYYFTGFYLIFILLLAVTLAEFARIRLGKAFLVLFLLLFLRDNGEIVRNYVTGGIESPNHISLGNQLEALDWVYREAAGREFNVDVYVPPVIPYAYDYLFLWQGTARCGADLCGQKLDSQVSLLYTLYEVDPPHPERLQAWLDRQKGFGVVEKSAMFGGVTAEQRRRVPQSN